MNILTYLSWVRKLWNTVVEIVKLIEETIPDDGAGKEKLAAFDIMLKAALDKADDIDESFDKLQPVAHDIVAAVVSGGGYCLLLALFCVWVRACFLMLYYTFWF